MFQIRGQNKIQEEPSEYSQSTQEKIQSNDCKHDQRTWKKNGCTEWEFKVFNKVLENVKESQTEVKNTLERINSRLNDSGEWISELEKGGV